MPSNKTLDAQINVRLGHDNYIFMHGALKHDGRMCSKARRHQLAYEKWGVLFVSYNTRGREKFENAFFFLSIYDGSTVLDPII